MGRSRGHPVEPGIYKWVSYKELLKVFKQGMIDFLIFFFFGMMNFSYMFQISMLVLHEE